MAFLGELTLGWTGTLPIYLTRSRHAGARVEQGYASEETWFQWHLEVQIQKGRDAAPCGVQR